MPARHQRAAAALSYGEDAGVLASASAWRPRIAPPRKPPPPAAETQEAELSAKHASRYRAWAELPKRTFDIDVLDCPKCHGRMKLLAMITDGASVARYLTKLGEPTDVPGRSPSRGRRIGRVGCCA
jgi:hypothetical protein